jgi:hypothetical protein
VKRRSREHFLSGPKVWNRLRELARAVPGDVAVAFCGRDAFHRLPLKPGSVLVVDFSRSTVGQGLVSPSEIIEYLDNSVAVHHQPSLHAKVFVFGDTAIIGSANISDNSETNLVEAAVETSDPRTVKAARTFVRRMAVDPIGPEYAREMRQFYQTPKRRFGKRTRLKADAYLPLTVVHLTEGILNNQQAREASALRKAVREQIDDRKFVVDSFCWQGPPPVARGDSVIQVVDSGSSSRIHPPGRVLRIERLRDTSNRMTHTVVIELPRGKRTRNYSAVRRKLGKDRSDWLRRRDRQRFCRRVEPAAASAIRALWST